jgi:hypothetical protein
MNTMSGNCQQAAGSQQNLLFCNEQVALPADAFLHILDFLSKADLVLGASEVSRAWLSMSRSPQMWTTLDAEHGLVSNSDLITDMDDLLELLERPQFALLKSLVPPDQVRLRKKDLEEIAELCPLLEDIPSVDSIYAFIDAHYLEVEDTYDWIDRNKEIQTRWQEEKAFVMQLEGDMMLREIFDIVINKREHTRVIQLEENIHWFSSGIMTIDRAFRNRFDMACELVRETKRATELSRNDIFLDGVKTELERVLTMTRIFEDEEGAFKLLYEKTRSVLIEFVEWRADRENETVAAATQADDEDNVSNPKKTELNEQSSDGTLQESQKTMITLPPPAKTPPAKRHKKA